MKIASTLIKIGNVFLYAWALMLMWNWIPSEIFGLPSISYMQSLALLVFKELLTPYPSISENKAAENEDDSDVLSHAVGKTFAICFLISIAFIAQLFI